LTLDHAALEGNIAFRTVGTISSRQTPDGPGET
jgi:hypothetical protein